MSNEKIYPGDGNVPHGALFVVYCPSCNREVVARRAQPGSITTCPRCGDQV